MSAPVVVGDTPIGYLVAPQVLGDAGVGARLVLHTAAFAAARLLDLARRARELPVRSRSELLAELLMSEAAVNEDLLDRARQLGIPVGDVTAAAYVLDVEGPWSYLAAPGCALCSVAVAVDPAAARRLLHDVFTTGRGGPS